MRDWGMRDFFISQCEWMDGNIESCSRRIGMRQSFSLLMKCDDLTIWICCPVFSSLLLLSNMIRILCSLCRWWWCCRRFSSFRTLMSRKVSLLVDVSRLSSTIKQMWLTNMSTHIFLQHWHWTSFEETSVKKKEKKIVGRTKKNITNGNLIVRWSLIFQLLCLTSRHSMSISTMKTLSEFLPTHRLSCYTPLPSHATQVWNLRTTIFGES